MNRTELWQSIYGAACSARLGAETLLLPMADPYVAACKLRHALERGDADSAGSTLRTIMVVIVVAAVVGAIGLAVRNAGTRAAACINSNGGC
jgi:hypothetical protein